jgi:tRNA threonylcarbamoyladenosine biosynthesis protein TsaB
MTRLVFIVDGLLCPLLDARMDEVYGAVYRFEGGTRNTLRPAIVGPVEHLLAGLDAPVIVLGEGARTYADRIASCLPEHRTAPAHLGHPRGSAVAQEALAALAAGADADAALVRPVYLRQSQPEEARRRSGRTATA